MKEALIKYGWVLVCEKPLEIFNPANDSRAKGEAAKIVIDSLLGVNSDSFIDFPIETHPERLATMWFLEQQDYKNLKILDIGCGLRKTVPEAIGIDIRPVTDICCSGDDLSMIQNKSIDLIVSRHSFEHMINPVKTLKEWIRVSKIGGRMFFILPDHGKINTMQPLYSGCNYEHLHAYTRGSFTDLISMFYNHLRIEWSDVVIENWSFCFVIRRIEL